MITIAIPTYNSERTVRMSLYSAINQEYQDKEILIVDDGSTDRTIKYCQNIIEDFKDTKIRLIRNIKNMGIGYTLKRLMDSAAGEYVIYLCSDDLFVDNKVLRDYATLLTEDKDIGVIGHFFYQFIENHDGATMVSRDLNIVTSSCNPSGMAFRRNRYEYTDRTFIEMPFMVLQALREYKRYAFIDYDTIAVRIHEDGNTATKEWYYKDSPIQNWHDICGRFTFYPMFIQLKNRCPKILIREILKCVKLNPRSLLNPSFWFCSLIAVIVPSSILKPLSRFYRHRFSRINARIIKRGDK